MIQPILRISSLFCFLVGISSYHVTAEELEGYFFCRIFDISITEIENGKVKRFRGFTDGLELGKHIKLDYSYNSTQKKIFLKARSIDTENDEAASFDTSAQFIKRDEFFRELAPWNFQTDGNVLFGLSLIRFYDFNKTFMITRYSKNNDDIVMGWNGIFTKLVGLSQLVAGLECSHPEKKLIEISKILQSLKY